MRHNVVRKKLGAYFFQSGLILKAVENPTNHLHFLGDNDSDGDGLTDAVDDDDDNDGIPDYSKFDY